jgi:hypothetical protein
VTGVIDVMGSKRRFAEIWPLRSYKIRPDTVSAACQRPSNACDVRGIMDWRVRNPAQGKVMTGVSTFHYKIKWTGEHYEVVLETTKIIGQEQRSQSAPTPFNPFPK